MYGNLYNKLTAAENKKITGFLQLYKIRFLSEN